MAVIRPTLTYGCEVWTTKAQNEKLLSFEHKIFGNICGAICENELDCWRVEEQTR